MQERGAEGGRRPGRNPSMRSHKDKSPSLPIAQGPVSGPRALLGLCLQRLRRGTLAAEKTALESP